MLRPLIVRPLIALAFLAAGAAQPLHAAEDYDNCNQYIDALPATLSTQGVWCLRDDLGTSITSGIAITINTNNVTIDCNDFKIGGLAAGSASTTKGIHALDRRNITIRHCNLRGFHTGIELQGGDGGGHLVEDNRLDNNLFTGIDVRGRGNLVRGNRILDTGGADGADFAFGIHADANMVGNTIDGLFTDAAPANPRGVVVRGEGNEVRGNLVRGLVAGSTGSAVGIMVFGVQHATVGGNRVIAPAPVNGTGIIGYGGFCSDNLVANFATPWDACQLVSGNHSH